MPRNFFKTVALVPGGLLPTRYELDLGDICRLYQEVRQKHDKGIWNVICWCLCYGYVMGHRATVNGSYKEAGRKRKKPCQCANTDKAVAGIMPTTTLKGLN